MFLVQFLGFLAGVLYESRVNMCARLYCIFGAAMAS